MPQRNPDTGCGDRPVSENAGLRERQWVGTWGDIDKSQAPRSRELRGDHGGTPVSDIGQLVLPRRNRRARQRSKCYRCYRERLYQITSQRSGRGLPLLFPKRNGVARRDEGDPGTESMCGGRGGIRPRRPRRGRDTKPVLQRPRGKAAEMLHMSMSRRRELGRGLGARLRQLGERHRPETRNTLRRAVRSEREQRHNKPRNGALWKIEHKDDRG